MIRTAIALFFISLCLHCTANAQVQKPHRIWQSEIPMADGTYFWVSSKNCAVFSFSIHSNNAYSNYLTAINLATGKLVWKQSSTGLREVISDSKYLYSVDYSGSLLTMDWATGQTVWSAPAATQRQGVVVENGTLYWVSDDLAVVAADTNSGRILWRTPVPADTHGFARCPTAFLNGKLYCHWRHDSQFMCVLDAKTGRILREVIFEPTEAIGFGIGRMLSLPHDNLFVCQERDSPGAGYHHDIIGGMKLDTLQIIWSQEAMTAIALYDNILLAATGELEPRFNEPPIPQRLVRINPNNGNILWSKSASGSFIGIWQGVAVFLHNVYEEHPGRNMKNYIAGYRPYDGKLLWKLRVAAKQAYIAGARLLAVLENNKPGIHLLAYQMTPSNPTK